MKLLFTTVLLWAGILLSTTHAQDFRSDTLNIIYQGENLIKMVAPRINQYKHQRVYQDLLSDFKSQLEVVAPQIPDYKVFNITYIKNASLRAEEVQGIVKYQIENGKPVPAYFQNKAILQDGNLKIIIRFNKMEELFEMDYRDLIGKAFLKVKTRNNNFFNILSSPFPNVFGSPREYFYSYSENKMVRGYEKVKFRNRVGLVGNASIGIFKNQPIYELNEGIGFLFGRKNENLFYIFHGYMYLYDKESSSHQFFNNFGLGIKPKRYFSMNFSIFPDRLSSTDFPDGDARLTVIIYPTKGIAISVHQYFNWVTGEAFPSVSVGLGF